MIITSEYDPATGQIYRNQYFDGHEIAELNTGEFYVDGEYRGEVYYILDGQPTERPASPVTIDWRTLSDVPAGSTLWIDGEQYEAEGDVELDFVMPGTYKLRVVCFPYLDWEYELVML